MAIALFLALLAAPAAASDVLTLEDRHGVTGTVERLIRFDEAAICDAKHLAAALRLARSLLRRENQGFDTATSEYVTPASRLRREADRIERHDRTIDEIEATLAACEQKGTDR